MSPLSLSSDPLAVCFSLASGVAMAICPFDQDCLNPFGAGSPFKADGLMHPYSE